jgi:ribonuclease HII
MFSSIELSLFEQGYKVCGLDEVGIGPLAGPVVAACCLIPPQSKKITLNDSKKCTPEERYSLFEQLSNDPNIYFEVGIIDNELIDQINILKASLLAMKQALEKMKDMPNYALIDGKYSPRLNIPHQKIIQGDGYIACIQAASIIAKVVRDELMIKADTLYPQYGFKEHKGYGTPEHLKAIKAHGPCPLHRQSYDPVKQASLLHLL